MKRFSSNGMRILKIIHLIAISFWTGANLAVFALSLYAQHTGGTEHFLWTYEMMATLFPKVILPSAIVTIITAILYGVFSNWGFFKFKWITVKWLGTILLGLTTGFGVMKLLHSAILTIPRDMPFPTVLETCHMAIKSVSALTFTQVFLLLLLIALSVIKPWMKRKRGR